MLITAICLTTTLVIAPPPAEQISDIQLSDVRESAGIDFEHYGERHRWCEIGPQVKGIATNEEIPAGLFEDPFEFANRHLIRMNGSGAAWIDIENDGDYDIYLVNGSGGPETTNALYLNMGDGTFLPQTKACGVLDAGEGMAVSVADYDNDGFSDMMVMNFGNFVLFRNNGDGTFSDVTAKAFPIGLDEIWYGTSSWGDFDSDGFLDVYIAGYVDLSKNNGNEGLRFPMDFKGFPNYLYHNNGDGTFTNIAKEAGVQDGFRKTMQVLVSDFNDDNRPDILVGNDTDPNGLYLNRGDGTFKEFSGPSGLSSTDGSMGIAWGDYNNDQMMDLYISNYTGEADLLLTMVDNTSSNDGEVKNAIFMADFESPIIQQTTWPLVGWGTGFVDLDNDTDLDLFVAGGHLNGVSGDNRDFNALFENTGDGKFINSSETSGVRATGKRIHRATIFGDYDNDGKIDFYVVNNGEESYDEDSDRHGVLYHNDSTGNGGWLKVKLQGTKSNRDAFGTKLKLVSGDNIQIREHVSGEGYFSSNAQEVHFGLGDIEKIDSLTLTWPSGKTQTITDIKPNQVLTLVEN
ncbi:MAG TPA: CRTAC1 family protein [Phycisphaerales bacterium]|nr:CRTAC1 family protein [Phycisphaerales bacterium]HIN84667.1 CRTAC1 family protein [Phycisphaerales bacterium]